MGPNVNYRFYVYYLTAFIANCLLMKLSMEKSASLCDVSSFRRPWPGSPDERVDGVLM